MAICQAVEYRVNFMSITTYRTSVRSHDGSGRMFGITRQGNRLVGN